MNTQAPSQNPNSQIVKIELSLDELNIVIAGLSELPVKHAMPIIEKIHKMVQPQLAPPQA